MQDTVRGFFHRVRVQQGRRCIGAQATGTAAAAAGTAVAAVLADALVRRAAALGSGLGLGEMGMRVIAGNCGSRIGLARSAGLRRMRHAASCQHYSRDALHREREGQQAQHT